MASNDNSHDAKRARVHETYPGDVPPPGELRQEAKEVLEIYDEGTVAVRKALEEYLRREQGE